MIQLSCEIAKILAPEFSNLRDPFSMKTLRTYPIDVKPHYPLCGLYKGISGGFLCFVSEEPPRRGYGICTRK